MTRKPTRSKKSGKPEAEDAEIVEGADAGDAARAAEDSPDEEATTDAGEAAKKDEAEEVDESVTERIEEAVEEAVEEHDAGKADDAEEVEAAADDGGRKVDEDEVRAAEDDEATRPEEAEREEQDERDETEREDAEEGREEIAGVWAAEHDETRHDEAYEEERGEHEDEHAEEYHDEHERRPTLAGRVLTGLIVFLVGAVIALWAAPRVAPHLPASISQYLETGTTVSGSDLAQIRSAFDGRMRAMEQRMLSVSTVTDLVDQQLSATRSTLEERIDGLADKIAATDSAAIESRLSGLETSVAGLRSQLETLSAGLSDIPTTGAGLSQEDAARIANFAATVEGLRGEIASLSKKSGELSQRIDDVAAAAARRVAAAEEEAEAVKAEAETAIRNVEIDLALDTLAIAVAAGRPFAAELEKVAGAAGTPPPDALAAAADAGAPTLAALRAAFPDAAHEAIAAAAEAEAGGSFGDQARAWFRAQFTGLPVEETEGDDVPAVLSRVSARLAEGDLDAALSETEALPEPAAAALAPWTERAALRRDALAALADYRAALEAGG